MLNSTLELGDKVRDTVSGFDGIIISTHSYLNGCRRLTLCPTIGADGAFRDERTFDEPQLELISKGAWKSPARPELARAVGGTAPDVPRTGSR